MPFYDEMQQMVKDLLAPDSQGGLGQSDPNSQLKVVLTRTTPGVLDPERDWVEALPQVVSETLLAAVTGAEEYADGSLVLATDRRVVAGVPTMNWKLPVGDDAATLSLTIDGQRVSIIRVRGIPSAGTPAAIELIARG